MKYVYRSVEEGDNNRKEQYPATTFSDLTEDVLMQILSLVPNYPDIPIFNTASRTLIKTAIARLNGMNDADIDRIMTEWLDSPDDEMRDMYNLIKFTEDKEKLRSSMRRIFCRKMNLSDDTTQIDETNEEIVEYIYNYAPYCVIHRESERMSPKEKFHLLSYSIITDSMNVRANVEVTHHKLDESDRIPLYVLILKKLVRANIFLNLIIIFNCNDQFLYHSCKFNQGDKVLLQHFHNQRKIINIEVHHNNPLQIPIEENVPEFEGFRLQYLGGTIDPSRSYIRLKCVSGVNM